MYGADVCGPFATASILGNTYMFCIIDYASKRVWCYFCKHKDQAFDFIKHFFEIELIRARAANRELGLVTLVTDGGELHSNKAAKVCARYNVTQQFTCYNTPENNSIMERIWRTLAEMAIAMLVDSGLPETFWEEARKHAVFIYNRVPPVREPTDDSPWMSPQERYYGTARNASLKHLTIPFGAKVIAFIDKEKREGKNHSVHGEECLYMGMEEDYIHGFRLYSINIREFIVTNHIKVVNSNDDYQLCPQDWPYINKDGGTSQSTPLHKDEDERLVSDFKYLENTFHHDDEDGLLYKVSRVGKEKGYIVAWRQLVLSDGTLDKEAKRPVHIRDVELCTDNTGVTLSNNAPLLPIDIAWTDRSSDTDITRKVAYRGVEQGKSTSSEASTSKAPNNDNKVENRAHRKRHVEGIFKDMDPISSGATNSSSSIPPTGGTRKYLSRSCKPGDNPRSTAHNVSVSMDRK